MTSTAHDRRPALWLAVFTITPLLSACGAHEDDPGDVVTTPSPSATAAPDDVDDDPAMPVEEATPVGSTD